MGRSPVLPFYSAAIALCSDTSERVGIDSIPAHEEGVHQTLAGPRPLFDEENATLAAWHWSRIWIAHFVGHKSRSGTTLATDNDPVDSREVDHA